MDNSLNLAYFLIDNEIRSNIKGVYNFKGKIEYHCKIKNLHIHTNITITISKDNSFKISALERKILISDNLKKYIYDVKNNCLTITSNQLKECCEIKIFKI